MNHLFYAQSRRRAFPRFLIALGCTLGSLMNFSPTYAQLSGTYTIGGDDGDYAGFNAATTALEAQGISGAVTFRVRPDTYKEQVIINSIPGSACEVPVVFEGQGATPGAVILQAPTNTGSASPTVQVNAVDGLIFRNMSIISQNGSIGLTPGTDCLTLENNVLDGEVEALSTSSTRSNYHQYRGNTFASGGIVKKNLATWNPSAPVFDTGLIIEGNAVGNIEINGQRDFKISENQLNNASISVTNSWYGHDISKNKIDIDTKEYNGTAIALNSGAATTISENQIVLSNGGTGMRITSGPSTNGEMLIANNFISVSGYDARGIFFDPLAALVGLVVSSDFSNTFKIYHNTVTVFGYSETFSVPNYTLDLSGEDNSFLVRNNVFGNSSSGTNLVINDPSVIAAMDYNNLYDQYAKLFARWGSQVISSLTEWQSVTNNDENSINVNPGDLAEPNEALSGEGLYVSEVPQDIFGRKRSSPPTIGAVELTEETTNQPPTANAGSDRTVTLPRESVTFQGLAFDTDGRFVAFRWEKVSGPEVTLLQANTAVLVVKDLTPGEYVFRFSATDNDGATASDEVMLTVKGGEPANQPPTANAGSDRTVTLPVSTLQFSGSGRDPDGVFRAFRWEKVSGPSVTLRQANTANLILSDLQAGEYVFRFYVTDNDGATASDEVTLTVKENNPTNQPPVAEAGRDRTIKLPVNIVSLSGLAFNANGRFVAFRWEKVSGPSVTLSQQNTANVNLTNLVAGVYTFRFSATDNGGTTVSDEVMLTVLDTDADAARLASDIKVSTYPNTFQDHVNVAVQTTEPEVLWVEVYDMVGRIYHRGQLPADLPNATHWIDLSGEVMTAGIYFLRVRNANSSFSQTLRIVKEY